MILIEVYCKEYERAVIFRLGRLLSGGARGPGVFFIIPCVDIYEKVDMRTQTFDVPPQEVSKTELEYPTIMVSCTDPHQGQRHRVRQCHHVLQGKGRHQCRGKC